MCQARGAAQVYHTQIEHFIRMRLLLTSISDNKRAIRCRPATGLPLVSGGTVGGKPQDQPSLHTETAAWSLRFARVVPCPTVNDASSRSRGGMRRFMARACWATSDVV